MFFKKDIVDADVSSEAQSALSLANDSQLTLVPASTDCTALVLSSDSALNTTFVADGVPLYELKSSGAGPHTDVLHGGEVVASYNRGLLSDIVIRRGEKTKVGKWATFVKPTSDASVAPMLFSSNSGNYTWIANRAGEAACFRQDTTPEPIAWYSPAKSLLTGWPTSAEPALSFAADTMDSVLRADVILAWIIFIERVRVKEAHASGQTKQSLAGAGRGMMTINPLG